MAISAFASAKTNANRTPADAVIAAAGEMIEIL
jgi:hypothetical protein